MTTLRRWIRFNLVGGAGVVVQLAALALLKSGLGMYYLAATFLAVEAAVLHNFVWHECWTWVERTKFSRSARDILSRLVRFNLANGLISIAGNLILMWAFVDRLHFHYLFANILAVVTCSIVNFILSDRLVFLTEASGAVAVNSNERSR